MVVESGSGVSPAVTPLEGGNGTARQGARSGGEKEVQHHVKRDFFLKNLHGGVPPPNPLPPLPSTIRSTAAPGGHGIGRGTCGTARQPLKNKDGFHARARGPSVFLLARLPSAVPLRPHPTPWLQPQLSDPDGSSNRGAAPPEPPAPHTSGGEKSKPLISSLRAGRMTIGKSGNRLAYI